MGEVIDLNQFPCSMLGCTNRVQQDNLTCKSCKELLEEIELSENSGA